jgi:hypothetical protein
MKLIGRIGTTLLLAAAMGGGCAHGGAGRTAERAPETASDRLTTLREAEPEAKAAAVEQRFKAGEDKERKEEAKAAKAQQQQRVDVVEPKHKPLPK